MLWRSGWAFRSGIVRVRVSDSAHCGTSSHGDLGRRDRLEYASARVLASADKGKADKDERIRVLRLDQKRGR